MGICPGRGLIIENDKVKISLVLRELEKLEKYVDNWWNGDNFSRSRIYEIQNYIIIIGDFIYPDIYEICEISASEGIINDH